MKIISRQSRYGRNVFVVELEESDKDKTDYDLIKEADDGNGCFGGDVKRFTDRTEIHVYTD